MVYIWYTSEWMVCVWYSLIKINSYGIWHSLNVNWNAIIQKSLKNHFIKNYGIQGGIQKFWCTWGIWKTAV